MDELCKIMDYHPEIIYLPEPVSTWHGFLIVECPSNSDIQERIKVKLVAPYYPMLTDVDISFGPQISMLNQTKFKEAVNAVLQSATSVFMLLEQASMYPFSQSTCSEASSKNELIAELKEFFSSPQDVSLSATKNLDKIILKSNKITITLRWKNGWEVIASDLPESFMSSLQKWNKSLKTITEIFLESINAMSDIWQQLEELDEQCHVMDPKVPKPCHLYRRIYLTDSLSICITLNPEHLSICPEIKFLGSEIVVEEMKEKLHEQLNDWDEGITIYDNLLKLLEIEEFPHPEKVEKSINACFNDDECCICFSLESEEGLQPNKICPNAKCGRAFHSDCLLQWLQCNGTNRVIFGEIFGKCPHCEESISCAVN